MQLVDLTSYIPDAIIDMRYANDRNVAGRAISDETKPRLIESAAQALGSVADQLRKQGYKLVIWDAYRTPEVQQVLGSLQPDQRYVLELSKHCQGLAVDLTLADANGVLLDMGTDHDDFSDTAHADATDITDEQTRNRHILTAAMEQGDYFVQWPFEWWHFDYVQ